MRRFSNQVDFPDDDEGRTIFRKKQMKMEFEMSPKTTAKNTDCPTSVRFLSRKIVGPQHPAWHPGGKKLSFFGQSQLNFQLRVEKVVSVSFGATRLRTGLFLGCAFLSHFFLAEPFFPC